MFDIYYHLVHAVRTAEKLLSCQTIAVLGHVGQTDPRVRTTSAHNLVGFKARMGSGSLSCMTAASYWALLLSK